MLGGLKEQTVDDLTHTGFVIVIYGAQGAGKTPIACNIVHEPSAAPATLVDVERGTRSVLHLVRGGSLRVVRPGAEDRKKIWTETIRYVKALRETTSPLESKTYIFDNMSDLAAHRMEDILVSKGKTEPEIQFWNIVTSDMMRLTRELVDISQEKNINVIMTAWEDSDKDESTGITRRVPAFNPALASRFPGLVDIVGRLSTDRHGTRTLSFAVSDRTAAKFRRHQDDQALKIPETITGFGITDYPLADMVATLREGKPWPSSKYKTA